MGSNTFLDILGTFKMFIKSGPLDHLFIAEMIQQLQEKNKTVKKTKYKLKKIIIRSCWAALLSKFIQK